jgi:SMC interacting uncharacterized protein involved in chromosome segregation
MTTISKAEFDALPDSLKTKFEAAGGDSYAMIEEDVEGLKKSKAQILQEKKDLQSKLDELSKFKSEMEQKKSAEEEAQMKKAGEFAELEKKLRAKITELEESHTNEKTTLLNSFKTERLKNELTAKGVLPDRAKYALADIAGQVDLVPGEEGFSLKVKNGIGDAKEFDALIDGLKQSSPFFFASNAASGGGASGSQGNNGTGSTTWTRAQWDAASTEERTKFSEAKGQIT